MIIMAQHPQQQQQQSQQHHQHPQQNVYRNHKQQAIAPETHFQIKTSATKDIKIISNNPRQLEQDGKRTLIKNQLYLIEQLQLENANLRNERDQLQLENEELKFQLQMISSSNILHQPGATFADNQQLDRLVGNDGKINGNRHDNHNNLATNFRPGTSMTTTTTTTTAVTTAAAAEQQDGNKYQLVTPLRELLKQQNGAGPMNNKPQQVASSEEQQQQFDSSNECQKPLVRLTAAASQAYDCKQRLVKSSEYIHDCATTTTAANEDVPSITTNITSTAVTSCPAISQCLATGKKSLAAARSKLDQSTNNQFIAPTSGPSSTTRSANSAPQSRDLPHDDDEQRVKLVEQQYGGDSEQVQAAAIMIQRAFRKYQICKRFRTITEQLRHTHQSATATEKQVDRKRLAQQDSSKVQNSEQLNYASGTTRAAAWESLSYAASRLAAAAKQQQQQQQVTVSQTTNLTDEGLLLPKPSGQPVLSAVGEITSPAVSISNNKQPGGKLQSPIDNRVVVQQQQAAIVNGKPPDPVVAAAINFQQLESIRKRQYRVGLNIFNKNPEKGVSFLVAHSFIDSSSPFSEASTGYYHSNQLHFIDTKQHLLQQALSSSSYINNDNYTSENNSTTQFCQLCCEEENLKRNVAHFLLNRKGLAKEKIGHYLGNLQLQFNQDVLNYYLQELDFHGLQIDIALRKFLSTFRLPGEAQKIERIVERFAQRYVQCQQQPQTNQNGLNTNTHIVPSVTQNPKAKQQQQNNQRHNNIQQQQQQQQQQQSVNSANYKNNLILLSRDEIFILTFAIIMLNTDLHSPSLKPTSRMSAQQFVNNLRGVFKSQTINEGDLIEIYDRVKANQITTTPDHVTHVMKVQQGLTVTNFQKKELPNLCVPHRRLVCFCRLFEVYDVNKKERVGQHQREIFLFNDLLLVTKLARRVRANATQLYTYRQSISLQGLYVQLFQSAHYNFGIRLCQRSNDETLIMFNARNELDQSRFVDDLNESIAEMDEMETIKQHNIIDSIYLKYLDRLRRHALMHNNNINSNSSNNNDINEQFVANKTGGATMNIDNQSSKLLNMIDNCDTIGTNTTSTKTNHIISVRQAPSIKDRKRHVEGEQDEEPPANAMSSSGKVSMKTMGFTTKATGAGSKEIIDYRVQSKFSSMMNLSSVTTDGKEESHNVLPLQQTNNDRKQQNQITGSRQNQSFVQQAQRVVDLSSVWRNKEQHVPPIQLLQQQQQVANRSTAPHQRRGSASSVHSLDSGLFLSRDVSPNQSN